MSFPEYKNPAMIQVRSNEGFGERPEIPCCFEKMENKRLSLSSRDRVAASNVVTVQYNDALFLGEVLACTQDCDEMWHVEVQVEQILTGLQSLITLRARLLGEGVPEAIAQPVRLRARAR